MAEARSPPPNEDEKHSPKEPHILFNLPGMQVHNGHFFLPFEPPWLLEEVKALPMYEGDILFGTYPRSGTPFLAEIMWLMYNKVDLIQARQIRQGARIRFLEHLLKDGNPLDRIRSQHAPRLLKTHLDASYFRSQIQQGKVKVIEMLRNPKDVLVSLYHFYTADPGYVNFPGSWDDFFQIFLAKQLIGGDWFTHARSWLEVRNFPNVLLLDYEKVYHNPIKEIQKVAFFCDIQLNSRQIEQIAKYLTAEVPVESPIGGWKDYFTPEQRDLFDKLYMENMKDTGLTFDNMY